MQEYKGDRSHYLEFNWGKSYLISNGIPDGKISMIPFAFEGEANLPIDRSYPLRFFRGSASQGFAYWSDDLTERNRSVFFDAIDRVADCPIEFIFAGSTNIKIQNV